jgi:heme exporter protein D
MFVVIAGILLLVGFFVLLSLGIAILKIVIPIVLVVWLLRWLFRNGNRHQSSDPATD